MPRRVTAKIMSQLLAISLPLGFGSVQLCASASGTTVADFGPSQQVAG